jgi:DNA-directed RNA polymerase specialized sigma24 family protein
MTIDAHLKQLATEAQRHPLRSPERQQALAQLVAEIWRSHKLVRPHRGQFQGQYEEIYAEAQQNLFLYVCEQIDRYNPEHELMQWVNFLMKQRFFTEASRNLLAIAPKTADRQPSQRITLEVLDKQNPIEVRSQSNASLSEEVIQGIREDPEGLFVRTYIEKKPNAHFQHIALRFLEGHSWKDISVELDVKVVTLSSFYGRCLTKFAPKFREYLSK